MPLIFALIIAAALRRCLLRYAFHYLPDTLIFRRYYAIERAAASASLAHERRSICLLCRHATGALRDK